MQRSLYFRSSEIFLRPLHHVNFAGVGPGAFAQQPDGRPGALCSRDFGAHFHVAIGLQVDHRLQARRGDAVAGFVGHDAQRAVLDVGVVQRVGVGLGLAIAPAVIVRASARLHKPFAGIWRGFTGVVVGGDGPTKFFAECQAVANGDGGCGLHRKVQRCSTRVGLGVAQCVKVVGLRCQLGGTQVKKHVEHVVIDARFEAGFAFVATRAPVGNEAVAGRAEIKAQVFPTRLGGAGFDRHPVVVIGVAALCRVTNFEADFGARLRRVHPHAQLCRT